ncbi:MAG: sipW [Marmoricola sp.]|nr:sipW [Marmoricola sp.]
MSLRTVRTVAGRTTALLAAGLVVAVLGLTVVIPKLTGATAYTILTGSMRPGMPAGTVVVVKAKPVDQIRIGDVVTYQITSGQPAVVTHRVHALGFALDGTRTFITQGDSNNAADRLPVKPEQIRGVRLYSVPYVGLPSTWIGASIRQVVVGGAVVLLLAYAAVSFVGETRERRRQRAQRRATTTSDFERVDA